MHNMKRNFNIAIFLLAAMLSSCKKLITVGPPPTAISEENVFETDGTAIGAVTALWVNYNRTTWINYDGIGNTFRIAGMMADELTLFNTTNNQMLAYHQNQVTITSDNGMWRDGYRNIYQANAAIEGLEASTKLTPAVKKHLIAEARFGRAFAYFFLLNFFGDVPLVTTTDYNTNSDIPRSPKADVYNFLTKDLEEAQADLTDEYLDGGVILPVQDRVRPNKWAAKALLARLYLYNGDWEKAASTATELINKTDLFDLPGTALDDVFLTNSKETIWASLPVRKVEGLMNAGEGALFVLPSTGPNTADKPVYLSHFVLDAFQPGDQRKTHWVAYAAGYPHAFKYKAGPAVTEAVERTIVFRIAEQYLIRAEARIRQGSIADGIDDLNVIRARATDRDAPLHEQLAQLSRSLTEEQALAAVLHERYVELFTEWGHRWFDLKRFGAIDARMNIVTPEKGGTAWQPFQALFPIPPDEILLNPSLDGKQNPGYPE